MGKTGNIVQGLAIPRSEFSGVRVQKVQGCNQVRHPLHGGKDRVVPLQGRAGNRPVTDLTQAAPFGELLVRLLGELARQIVADGEGVSRVYRVVVQGAASARQARQASATVATSPLVKTAMAGADVNWGRIMAALGRSGARFDPEQVSIAFGPHVVAANGQGRGDAAEAAARELILAGPFTVTIDLGAGDYHDFYDTCDFTEDYIRINASYRS